MIHASPLQIFVLTHHRFVFSTVFVWFKDITSLAFPGFLQPIVFVGPVHFMKIKPFVPLVQIFHPPFEKTVKHIRHEQFVCFVGMDPGQKIFHLGFRRQTGWWPGTCPTMSLLGAIRLRSSAIWIRPSSRRNSEFIPPGNAHPRIAKPDACHLSDSAK